MTELQGPEDGFDLGELVGYLEELQVGVDAQVTEARLLGLRTQALKAIDPALDRLAGDGSVLDDLVIGGSGTEVGHDAMAAPVPLAFPTVANPYAHMPDRWPGRPSPLPLPPIPLPPMPAPPVPSPLPMPPLPAEPVPAPPSSTPAWREPEDGGNDGGPRGVSKRQR